MKIKFLRDNTLQRSMLEATPGELDGYPPIPRLLVNFVVDNLSPDRLAIASLLAFRRYVGGEVILEDKISALTAQCMMKLMEPRWVSISPIHPANLPIPRGKTVFRLSSGSLEEIGSKALSIVDSYEYSGALIGENRLIVPSNAAILDRLVESKGYDAISSKLAVAVLLSEDLDISIIEVTEEELGNESDVMALKDLLGCVGLGLKVVKK